MTTRDDNLVLLNRRIPPHELDGAKRYLVGQCGQWQHDINRHDLTLEITSPQKARGIIGALGKLDVFPSEYRHHGKILLQITEEPQIENMRRIGIRFSEGVWDGITSATPVASSPDSLGR